MSQQWTPDQIPNQSGRTIVITGANSGLGFEAARMLGERGAKIILACRNAQKAADAAAKCGPNAEVIALDLADLGSVRGFAKTFTDRHAKLDILINNAGVMALPRRETADGFEMQFGTNHLGHFALTGLLLPHLLQIQGSRVVNLSSTAHKAGRMNFDDLHGERSYWRWPAYGQSKLANLLFTYELQRRLEAANHKTVAAACHPGWAATNLQFEGARMDESPFMSKAAGLANRIFSQDAIMGALPTVYAAVAPEINGGDYIGPDGFQEMKGHPKKVRSTTRSHDLESAQRLWTISEEQTGVRFGF